MKNDLTSLSTNNKRHVFVVQSYLQYYLFQAIVRDEQINVSDVLVYAIRGMYTHCAALPYACINGDNFRRKIGYNIVRNWSANHNLLNTFRAEVLALLAAEFEVYAAMYSRWETNLLTRHATKVHILEDGLGSYLSFDRLAAIARQEQKNNLVYLLKEARLNLLAGLPTLWQRMSQMLHLLQSADKYFATSKRAFVWADAERLHVLKDIYTPQESSVSAGSIVWAPSCLVEAGVLSMEDYLAVLRTVGKELRRRGVKEIFVKWHPNQIVNRKYVSTYTSALAGDVDPILIKEIPHSISVEGIAVKTDIALLTGVSTLGIQCHNIGRRVISYLRLLVEKDSWKVKGQEVLDIFKEISEEIHP